MNINEENDCLHSVIYGFWRQSFFVLRNQTIEIVFLAALGE